MEIRKSTPQDIPEIVELLRLSLGESLLPKSEQLWNWKHTENPFGPSPVLLALENKQIVGVRAFLRWNFANQTQVIHACRAVDTAIHPDYQRKGIFTKLTMGLIEEVRNENLDCIFNTPNTQSTLGYLKMGWEKFGKLPLLLRLRFSRKSKSTIPTSDWTLVRDLATKLEHQHELGPGFSTHFQPGYIFWRYENCPLFPYHYLSDGENFLLVFRIKEGKWGNEFRICDLLLSKTLNLSAEKNLQGQLQEAIQQSGCQLISFSGLKSNLALGLKFLPKLSIGPLVTLRQIKHGFVPNEQEWSWSIGDLEVF
ncbi:MAG: GNAT family N-acetyltransferase [Cyclobacteriaceae bacterium]|nr:GNAT family N-acetyltransferase [Cyclobacteriaceae bacterium]MDX5466030.1 GNAT family N-acetyltransferase [Cyclobacteriaceae bacterium]